MTICFIFEMLRQQIIFVEGVDELVLSKGVAVAT